MNPENLLKGECHIHYYRDHPVWKKLNPKGDSLANLEKYYISEAKRKGLGFIFLTPDASLSDDRFNYTFELTNKYNGENGFLVLAGTEISLENAHLLVLGIKEKIKNCTSLNEIKTAAKEQDALLVAAHPHTPGMWDWELFLEGIENNIFDGIEFNLYTYPNQIKQLEILYNETLYQHDNLFVIGGSDVHGIPEDIGTIGMTYVIASKLNKKTILKSLREGNSVARYGNKLTGPSSLVKQLKSIFKR